jgi:hypothetical protein
MNLRPLSLGCALALALPGCTKKDEPKPAAPVAAPAKATPLEPLQREVAAAVDGGEEDALYRVVPLPVVGPAVPEGLHVKLDGEQASVAGRPFELSAVKGAIILEPTDDTYLVQAAALFAQLDDAKAEVWFKHPDAALAFKVTLRDEPSFQAWIDEPVPGKLRVVHRADGYELQTNMGKLPGGDPNGPTVPVRGGKFDLKTLQRGFERIHGRFKAAPDFCIVPSFGMELNQTVRAIAANYTSAEASYFGEASLIYPRPAKDAGAVK